MTPGISGCACVPTETSSPPSARHRVDPSPTDRDASPRPGCGWTAGEELEADIIVTATGLQLLALGGLEFTVDGRPLNIPDRLTYKGLMLDGLPNAALSIGYTNASWTLKCDLTCEYVCRVLNHMSEHGYRTVVPVAAPARCRRRRCWTSPPATCSARWTSSRARAPNPRGGCARTTRATS